MSADSGARTWPRDPHKAIVLTQDGYVDDDGDILLRMAMEVHDFCEAKGWFDDQRSFGDEIALLHSEASESLDAYRDHDFEPWFSYRPTVGGVKMPKMTREQVIAVTDQNPEELGLQPHPEGAALELGGLLVRILDTCSRHGINLFQVWREEMSFDWTREYRHGNRRI